MSSVSCPGCGEPMALARVTPRAGPWPELHTYECRACREVMTLDAPPPHDKGPSEPR